MLATVPGITQVCQSDPWIHTWHWSFTTLSARRLFEEVFSPINVTVISHGNVLAAVAFLEGMSQQELRRDELDYHDPDYPLIITVRAQKTPIERCSSKSSLGNEVAEA